ncbi:Uncharacterised protein [Candidatus Tiddalikarchaeum anstoanum]|nr:Uncharacterised protein [Candidatus Tiddalikarchaeum anstoanum]
MPPPKIPSWFITVLLVITILIIVFFRSVTVYVLIFMLGVIIGYVLP